MACQLHSTKHEGVCRQSRHALELPVRAAHEAVWFAGVCLLRRRTWSLILCLNVCQVVVIQQHLEGGGSSGDCKHRFFAEVTVGSQARGSNIHCTTRPVCPALHLDAVNSVGLQVFQVAGQLLQRRLGQLLHSAYYRVARGRHNSCRARQEGSRRQLVATAASSSLVELQADPECSSAALRRQKRQASSSHG